VVIKNDSLQRTDNGEISEVVLSKNQVSNLKTLLTAINLSSIDSLKAPSEKRTYDAAISAYFKITVDGVLYTSSTFDHEHPPKELDKLYQFIKTMN